jgi:uncharacterized protein (TIGR03032 family)
MMAAPPPQNEHEPVNCSVSDDFHAWMASCGGSIALTTYQGQRVGLIGFDGRRVSPLLREFPTPMGLCVHQDQLALATQCQVILFANAPVLAGSYPGAPSNTYDGIYLPRVTYHTGDLRVHDVAFGQGELWIVNTLLSCIGALSQTSNFEPRWKPPFISNLAAEDRCHLNGMAMIDGIPRFATALGATDVAAGWRSNKASGGVLIDVPSGQNVLTGLSMPHSPRWHDGKLWLLNSGSGELCIVDTNAGKMTTVAVLPGFLRGLGFAGPFALIGLSQIRQSNIFGGLLVKERFPRLLCGVAVVDTRTGRTAGMFEFTSGLHELFEAQFLPGVRRPMILQPGSEEAGRVVTSRAISYWLGSAEPS